MFNDTTLTTFKAAEQPWQTITKLQRAPVVVWANCISLLHLLFCSWEIPALRNVLRIPVVLLHVMAWVAPHSETCTFPHPHWRDSQRCLRRERNIICFDLIWDKNDYYSCYYLLLNSHNTCIWWQIETPVLTGGERLSWTCRGMWGFTLADVDKVALSFAAHSLCEQVSVISDVFAQCSRN